MTQAHRKFSDWTLCVCITDSPITITLPEHLNPSAAGSLFEHQLGQIHPQSCSVSQLLLAGLVKTCQTVPVSFHQGTPSLTEAGCPWKDLDWGVWPEMLQWLDALYLFICAFFFLVLIAPDKHNWYNDTRHKTHIVLTIRVHPQLSAGVFPCCQL
jgi:hypothetical protein